MGSSESELESRLIGGGSIASLPEPRPSPSRAATPPSNETGPRPPDAPGQLFDRPPSAQLRKEKMEINNGFVKKKY